MNKKKLVAVFTMLCFLFTLMPMAAFAGVESQTPALPTATVTEIENEDLTFAMNFKAVEPTDEQKAYYGDWYADFELTVNKDVTFNADGSEDGYLSGQYDAWSENWVNVPFENVTLTAGQSLKIMEYASKMMNQGGLQITYADVVNSVKDFDCGVFFTDEFLAANPDLVVTLELKMYNPTEGSTESYTIGETYTFKAPAPELPTATVTEIENEDLTFAMNFKADEVSEDQLAYYGDWYADFELTVNKDVTFNAEGGANGYLSGSYEAWNGGAWVNVPFVDKEVKANEPLKIMATAAEMLNRPGLKFTYGQVYELVKDFNCGVYFTPEFLSAEENEDLEVTLELKMYNPADETEAYVIGNSYVFPPYTVTWDVDGVTTTEEVVVGMPINPPADPEKDGYTFAGWDGYTDGMTMPAKDVTFTAKWTKNDVETEAKPSTGSSGGGFSGVYNYPVALTSDDDYSVKSDKNNAVKGETVTITVTPENGKEVDEVIVTDAKGNKLTVTKVGENKYTFVMPASKVNVAVTMQDADNEKLVLKIGSNTYHKDGVAGHTDVTPVIKDGRTLVPIRVIVEALGGTVDWDDATRTVTITIDGKVLKLVIDKEIPGYGTGAIIIEGRTMVPIRYISEYVGYDVEWIAATQQVVIDINN